MAGIYLHIPFCRQRCSYCDFHFSTNLKFKNQMVEMIGKELLLRKNEIRKPVETIYFGGGTPSLLGLEDLNSIFEKIYSNYSVIENPEITLEANPDDLTFTKLKALKSTPVNRLSIGIQSFFDEDLRLMNRVHSASEAEKSVKLAQDSGFENITIDLIYGGQTTTDEMWKENLSKALELNVPHISSYALTVEPKTVLAKQIETRKIKNIDEEKQERQFKILVETLTQKGFDHYEISNFGKKGFWSQHNSNYWKGKLYLGIGPSAHSFDGKNRSWNIANNTKYIQSLSQDQLANKVEVLSENEIFNELIMIGLRTIFGVDLIQIKKDFPEIFYDDLMKESKNLIAENFIQIENEKMLLTEKGKFLADGIAAQLFRI